MTRHTVFRLFLPLTVALCMSCAHALEEPIGRLFSNPRERAELDQERQKSGKKGSAVRAQIKEMPIEQITLDGYVRHSSGKTTAWINQTPQRSHENSQGITVLQAGKAQPAVSMQLPSGKKLDLKAGQSFEVTREKITEVYENAAAPASNQPSR